MGRITCVITAGPTREYLDPVRYLSNASSGKMGYALAGAAHKKGWRVILVTGPVELPVPAGVTAVPVVSARDMQAAVQRYAAHAQIIIGAAAVADWRPARYASAKIKKAKVAPVIRMVANPDIIKECGMHKAPGTLLVGFALETNALLANARKKMREKNMDMVIANRHTAIGRDSSSITILHNDGTEETVIGTKTRIAQRIIDGVHKKVRHI